MSKFLNLITAANAASAASSAYELRQRQEEYAQEAWEREEARKEREEEKSRQREERQAADEEKKEREKRWDYKTEGIRGGIEAIMKYRDPSFRFKLLNWHKEGMLRTEDEVEEIKSLMSETVDLIITNELRNILAGERDDADEINPDSRAYYRAQLLEMLRINVLNNSYINYVSADVGEQFHEACESNKSLLERIEKKKEKRMLCEAYRDTLNGLIRARKFPQKLIGGVFGWYCKYSPGNRKWWLRGICVFVTPALWFLIIPIYLLLWIYVSCKASEDIRGQKLALRRAVLDASHCP